MKILFLTSDLRKIGGIQLYNKNLIEAAHHLNSNSYRIEYIGSGPLMKALFVARLFFSLILSRPRLIWCGHINFGLVTMWMSKLFRIPYFVSAYGIDVWEMTVAQRRVLRNAKRIISISRFTANKMIEQSPDLYEKIEILPPALFQENRFTVGSKPKYLEDHLGLGGKKVILTIARLSAQERYKGYNDIIDALPDIISEVPNARYVIVGEGDDAEYITNKIKKMGLEDRVALVGSVSDAELPDYYNLCDVFAMPSSQEGFGIVFIEALASGKPVVALSAGGSSEALAGAAGKMVTLLKGSDAEGLKRAIVKACASLPTDEERNWVRNQTLDMYGYSTFKSRLSNLFQKYRDHFSVCYFGNYPSDYPRARVFINGLRENNVSVIECRSNHPNRIIRLIILFLNYLRIWNSVDVILVAEAGQSYIFLAKLFSLITRTPVAIDAFLSYYHVETSEGKIPSRSLKGRYYYYLDLMACRLASMVFLDTSQHVDYFVKTFKIDKSKFRPILVGSDNRIFYPRSGSSGRELKFKIFNVSSFYPLHGVEYIVRAAKLLEKDKDIEFNIYGDGPLFLSVKKIAQELNVANLSFFGRIDIKKLPEIMSQNDLCLGQFGGTIQFDMVIPTKVFDAIAMKKPIITADGLAVRSTFRNGDNIILCKPRDPSSLAEEIIRLKNDKKLMAHIGSSGYKFFIEHASPKIIGQTVKKHLSELIFNKAR